MTEIAALKAEEKRLASEINRVQKLIHDAECDAAGVHVGDIVIYKGIEHRVTRIETWTNPPWLHGVRKNKDGAWSVKQVCMYRDWRKP